METGGSGLCPSLLPFILQSVCFSQYECLTCLIRLDVLQSCECTSVTLHISQSALECLVVTSIHLVSYWQQTDNQRKNG